MSTWRERVETHKSNALAFLRERGPRGVTSEELYADHSRFGVSPRNRISELRLQDGFDITTTRLENGMVRYVLLAESCDAVPVADHDSQPHYSRNMAKARKTTGAWRSQSIVPSRPPAQPSLFDLTVRP